MMIPLGLLLTGVIAWAGNKAIPAIYTHKLAVQQSQLEAAKYLCEQKNDCEAYKHFALYGFKKVKIKVIPLDTTQPTLETNP